MAETCGTTSVASMPSQRVIVCAPADSSACLRGVPDAMSSAASESSAVRIAASPSASPNQYARESPTLPACTRSSSTYAATIVHAAGLSPPGVVWAATASLATATARVNRAVTAALREAGVPIFSGRPSKRTSRAARAAARAATSESVDVVTPSHTTSTAREPGVASAAVASASSLRACLTPRSHTPPTHAAGVSSK